MRQSSRQAVNSGVRDCCIKYINITRRVTNQHIIEFILRRAQFVCIRDIQGIELILNC